MYDPVCVRVRSSVCVSSVSPLQLGAPEDVFLAVHHDGEVLVLALLDGVGACGDGAHLPKLEDGEIGRASCRERV